LIKMIGWIIVTVHFVVVWFAVIQSIREKKMRAAGLFSLACLPSILIGILLLSPESEIRNIILVIYIVFSALLFIIIFLPFPSKSKLNKSDEIQRVDERDAVFHRFYRLRKGTPEWDSYYNEHPELLKPDQDIRTMPQLQATGSKTYDPITSQFSHAAFDIVEPLASHLDKPDENHIDQVPISPEDATARLEGFAKHLGAVSVGTTQLNPAWIYSHNSRGPGEWGAPIELNHQWAIVIAVKMDTNMIRCAPENTVITESAAKYAQAALIARIVERTIRRWGYAARSHVDSNYRVMCVPVAVDAGLGEIGRHGLLITPQFGSMVRLAVITTDLPLVQAKSLHFGVQEFCQSCMKCARNCPSGSILKTEQQKINGVNKWQINRESCYQYWRQQGTDCSLCIRVCPYSHPDNILHRSVRGLLKRNRLLIKPTIILDDLLYNKKPDRNSRWPKWHRPSIG